MKLYKRLLSLLFVCVFCLYPVQVHASGEVEVEKRTSSSMRVFEPGELVSAIQMPRLSGGLNGYFYVKDAVSWGFCAENGKDFWYHNEAKEGYITEWDNPVVRKILYYAPGSPGYTGTDTAYDMDNATFAMGYMNGMSANNTRAKAYIAALEKLQDPIVWNYKAYRINITPDNYQDVVFLGYGPKGYLEIVKYSTDRNVTEGNNNYSLAGAVYGVYAADGDYSSPEYTITITAWKDGWSGLPVGAEYGWGRIEVPPGEYWVKELVAPPGYELDTNWYPSYSTPITVKGGSTARVEVNDEPQMLEVDLLLKKVKEQECELSLEGALFRVEYYGILLNDVSEDPGCLSEELLYNVKRRSWVFRTDENGVSYYKQDFLSSGDDLFYNSDGNPSLPIGTITIKEIKAPEGFLKNEETFVMQITGEDITTAKVFQYPIILEATMDMEITKKQLGTDIFLEGAVFEYRKPNGTTETITTDENGKILMQGLGYGIHELREISAPEGYEINAKVIRFRVEEDSQVTFLSEMDDTVAMDVSDKGNIEINIYDKVAPYELILHKQNVEGFALEGAEFALYKDAECTVEVQKGTTGQDGALLFVQLEWETKYYLKETKAPEGYRTPLDENGNPIVTEIYICGAPAINQLDLYVNGEQYDFGAKGTFSLGGTKEKQQIHVVVVNEFGQKLPQTGSSMTLIMVLFGIILFIGGMPCLKGKEKIRKIKERKERNMKRKKRNRILGILAIVVFTLTSTVGVFASYTSNVTVEEGVINCGQGEAKIVIHGNDGQSLIGKKFRLYHLMNVENAKELESVNYTINPEFEEVLKSIVGQKIQKEISKVTEYEVIDYIQSLNNHVIEGANAEQNNEGEESAFRYFVEEVRNQIAERRVTGDCITVTSIKDDNSIVLEGLEYGYYIVDEVTDTKGTEQAASLCMVSTTNDVANVNVKSDYPILVQKILEDDNREVGEKKDGWNDVGDYEIGQKIPFRFVSNIPNLNGYDTYYYAWHDVMDDALSFQMDTVKIEIIDVTQEKSYILDASEYKIDKCLEIEETFKIEIDDIKLIVDREFGQLQKVYGQQVRVTFEAVVNENAGEKTGTCGMENDVRLEFSNNPDSDGIGETGFTAWDSVVCFTYGLDIVKQNNHELKLEGAKFRLYKDEACTDEVYVKKNGRNYYVSSNDEGQELVSDEKGSMILHGLDEGNYYLKETKAPKGYRKLDEPLLVQIESEFADTRDCYIKGNAECMLIGLKASAKSVSSDMEKELSIDLANGRISLIVVNDVGKKLPITGSVLTLVMMVTGSFLVIGYLISKEKHEKVD